MTREANGRRDPRAQVLTLATMLDVFVPGALRGVVHIEPDAPLVGELLRDATGRWLLAPEPDDRGTGMHSIPLHDLDPRSAGALEHRIVRLTGVFEDGIGVTVTTIADRDPPDPPRGTTRRRG